MQKFRIANLDLTVVGESSGRICYVLYPFDCLDDWIASAARKFGVSMALVTGIDWDDALTPWPAKGQPPGAPDFKGCAADFLSTLITWVIPEVERRLHILPGAERTLAGVSLSGLFTLWQWAIGNTFRNIISLSGSFWYHGFVEWLTARPIPRKDGKAYFLLGALEAKTKVKAFQPVQTDTAEIVTYLRRNGIECFFELVPGNHYQDGVLRLDRAFSWMFLKCRS